MTTKAQGSITITLDGTNKSTTLPLLGGTLGPQVADIRKLYGDLGIFTFDPGYGATASCESTITYIDGDAGVLLYRGYPIEQLAEKSSFLEISYLLLNGDLPNAAQYEEFRKGVTYHTMLHEQLRRFFDGFRRDAHPMAIMCGVVGALAAFYHDNLDINDARQREIAAFRLIAKVPTIAAWAYKYSIGQPFMYPRNDLTYAENFLYMLNAVPAEPWVNNPILARAMDRIMILHADHEQNASTSTVRLAGSTGANPFACIAAGIAAHLRTRAEVRSCADTLQAEQLLRAEPFDVLICRDELPGEPGIMFLARHTEGTPWMRRILICSPLEPELLLHIINDVRVFRCVVEPCPEHVLHRHVDQAVEEAVAAHRRFLAAAREEQPARILSAWTKMLPRLALLTVLTCGGVFLVGAATLFVLYLLKSVLGIDLFSDAHLSSLWR